MPNNEALNGVLYATYSFPFSISSMHRPAREAIAWGSPIFILPQTARFPHSPSPSPPPSGVNCIIVIIINHIIKKYEFRLSNTIFGFYNI